MAQPGETVEAPWTGQVPIQGTLGAPAAGGLPALVRIPLPGPDNLVLSLRPPKGWVGKSTSTVFIMQGKFKGLRLDYGPIPKTTRVEYHWNRKGFGARFPIQNHSPAGRAGAILYESARAFRHAGTILVVIGVAMDVESIVVASNPLRRSTQVVSAWALAWAGARGAGALGAEAGTLVEPGIGTAVGGIVFAIGGGIAGYWAGERAGADVYDWAADTVFAPLSRVAVPDDMKDELQGLELALPP